jgi:hypothetical protein
MVLVRGDEPFARSLVNIEKDFGRLGPRLHILWSLSSSGSIVARIDGFSRRQIDTAAILLRAFDDYLSIFLHFLFS